MRQNVLKDRYEIQLLNCCCVPRWGGGGGGGGGGGLETLFKFNSERFPQLPPRSETHEWSCVSKARHFRQRWVCSELEANVEPKPMLKCYRQGAWFQTSSIHCVLGKSPSQSLANVYWEVLFRGLRGWVFTARAKCSFMEDAFNTNLNGKRKCINSGNVTHGMQTFALLSSRAML